MLSSLALSASALFTILSISPSSVQAHGQLSWIRVGGSQNYPAWNLDDHYTAKYKKENPQWGRQPDQKYSRKTDATDLGPTSVFSNAIATGGYQDSLDFDDISPVGVIPANSGDEVIMRWDEHWPWPGHPGPAGEYMAKCPGSSCTKVDATTLDWFCIAQHNYNKDTGKWPTESMPSNREWTFKLPTGLPSGAYIVRHELIALHNTTGPVPGTSAHPQHYPVSIEITYNGDGSTPLPTGPYIGRLPGFFSYDDYEWHHSIWEWPNNNHNWEYPGIPVFPQGYTEGVVNGATARVRANPPAQNQPQAPSSSSVAPSSSSAVVPASSSVAASSIVNNNHVVTSTSATGPSSTSVAVPEVPVATQTKPASCRIKTKRNGHGLKRVRRSRL